MCVCVEKQHLSTRCGVRALDRHHTPAFFLQQSMSLKYEPSSEPLHIQYLGARRGV